MDIKDRVNFWTNKRGDGGGRFIRPDSVFRSWVTDDGTSCFEPEIDRYRLYVSYACPWAHRCLIVRALKGLENVIPVYVVDYALTKKGWHFSSRDGAIPDPEGTKLLSELYKTASASFSGRVTVPVLWDTKTRTIVNNESSEIIQIFNSAFNKFSPVPELDLNPKDLLNEMGPINERIYHTLNNGVYKCGFATTQQAYDENIYKLFDTMDFLEERLSHSRFLMGDCLTLADIRLFTTLIRFDEVYVTHFKTNLRRLVDYPNLYGYTKEIFQMEKVTPTVNFYHIKNHYYGSHVHINPYGIVPAGPTIDYSTPHGRDNIPK